MDMWEKINRGANLYTVASALWLPEWLGMIAGVVEAFVAWGDIPNWAIAPAAIFTGGCVLWVFNLTDQRRERKARQIPDYALWDSASDFTTWDAACLWDEKPLTVGTLTERGLKIMRDIKDAIDDHKIAGAPLNPDGKANRNTRVTREQLRALAGIRGETPTFLFKNVR